MEGQGEGDGGKHEEREGNGATGTVNVGTGSATVNVGNNAPATINIGATGSTVYIGEDGGGVPGAGRIEVTPNNLLLGDRTNSIVIGNNNATYGATGSVQLGRGCASINIGNLGSSTIVIGNAAGTVTINSPLTLASGGILGEGVASTVITGTLPAGGSGTNINSISLPAGVWIVTGNGYFSPTTDAWLAISANSGARDSNGTQSSGTTLSNFSINVTRTYSGSAITFYLVAYSVAGGIGSPRLNAIRIG